MCLSNIKFVSCALMSGYRGADSVLECLQFVLFQIMRETLIYLAHLDQEDTEQQVLVDFICL